MSAKSRLKAELALEAEQAGLVAFSVSRARKYRNVAVLLEDRDRAGLRDTMQFTYRNRERSTDPRATLKSARSVISAALAYGEGDPEEGFSVIARYGRRDTYSDLRARLGRLATLLENAGHHARVVADSNALVDKEPGVRGGGGWYLRNSLYSVPVYGSFVVIGSVITDAELDPIAPRRRLTGCGSCTTCVEACPTGAILPGGAIDARRCISWQLQKPGLLEPEIVSAMGVGVYGCDICQDVCPYNRRARRFEEDPNRQLGELESILTSSDAALLERFAHLYLPKRDPAVLRRNALAALGNLAGRGVVDKAGDLARRWIEDPDPVLRSTAIEALARLGGASNE